MTSVFDRAGLRLSHFALSGVLAATALLGAHAQEGPAPAAETAIETETDLAALRATLGQRIPQLRDVDEITATPMQGLYEVRVGTDVFYVSGDGDFLIQGELIDIQAMRNLTEDRIKTLTEIDYATLPFDDAFTIVRGDGSRKLALFADPNCGYCKRFERDLLDVDNVTVHVFLYPILSPDSFEKSRDIWCASDSKQTWDRWMLDGQVPASQASCADFEALPRNLAFGRRYKITGTPTVVFEDNTRVPGAVPAAQVEQKLQELAAGSAS